MQFDSPDKNIVKIETLSPEGRGVVHLNGKTIFVKGALPDEEVTISVFRKRSQYDEAQVVEIIKKSSHRVEPKCPHFGICGGCKLQHIEHLAQVEYKQQIMLKQLEVVGGLTPEEILSPIVGPAWGYRRRARLGVKYVAKKSKVLVGFHENDGRFLADIQGCLILHPAIGEKIKLLSELIQGLSIFNQIPQIEVACGDKMSALVLRCLKTPTEKDLDRLRDFSCEHCLQIYLQPEGIGSIALFSDPIKKPLSYKLERHDVELLFSPASFIQINADINTQMADIILQLLNPTKEDVILDLFCGLGNFTLPLAKYCKEIVGIEGSEELLISARKNAEHNSIENATFYLADLNNENQDTAWFKDRYSSSLLDPPRVGAIEICKNIAKLGVKRIVYVSCNPITLARDAKELNANGYRLYKAGILDMFPHTAHVETITLFEKND